MPGKSVHPSRPPFLVPIAPTHFHWLLHLHLRAHPLFHENIIFQHPFPGQILKDLLSIPIFQIFRNRFFCFLHFSPCSPKSQVAWMDKSQIVLWCKLRPLNNFGTISNACKEIAQTFQHMSTLPNVPKTKELLIEKKIAVPVLSPCWNYQSFLAIQLRSFCLLVQEFVGVPAWW